MSTFRLHATLLASLAFASLHASQPVFYFDFNKAQEILPNAGLMKGLLLRVTDRDNTLAMLIGPSETGVSGESGDSAVHLTDGACLGFLADKGGSPLLENAGTFTLSAWYKSPQLSETSRWPVLFKNLSSESEGGFHLAVSPGGKPIASFGTETGPKKTALLENVWLVDDDYWRFFALTFDGERLRFYAGSKSEPVELIGELVAPVEKVADPADPSTAFFGQSGGVDNFNGWIDNFRLFDAALTKEELDTLRKDDIQTRE